MPSALDMVGVVLSPTSWHSLTGRKESKPSPSLLSRGAHSAQETRPLDFFCRGPVIAMEVLTVSAHSCASNCSFKVSAARSWTLRRQGQGKNEETEVNSPLNRTRDGRGDCPPSPC